MDAVDPTVGPETFYPAEALSRYPQSIRHHLWRNEVKGSTAAKDLCIRGTDEERKIREEARRWLKGA